MEGFGTTSSSGGMGIPSSTSGRRPNKGNERRQKGVSDYVAQFRGDLVSETVNVDGKFVQILICRSCLLPVGPRTAMIMEHFDTQPHQESKAARLLKYEKTRAGRGRNLRRKSCAKNRRQYNLAGSPRHGFKRSSGHESAQLPGSGTMMPPPPPLKKFGMSPRQCCTNPGSAMPAPFLFVNNLQLGGGSDPNPHISSAGPSSLPKSSDDYQSPPDPSKSKLVCLKWANFDANMGAMFTMFRSQGHFVDASLWVEGKMLKCHKLILSACSAHFDKLLREDPCTPHPIIFLNDMRCWVVEALLEYMYQGEVSVEERGLPDVIRGAEALQIRGFDPSLYMSGESSEGEGIEADGKGASESVNRDEGEDMPKEPVKIGEPPVITLGDTADEDEDKVQVQ